MKVSADADIVFLTDAVTSGEDERQGALKRLSSLWSSIRRGKRESEYDPLLGIKNDLQW